MTLIVAMIVISVMSSLVVFLGSEELHRYVYLLIGLLYLIWLAILLPL